MRHVVAGAVGAALALLPLTPSYAAAGDLDTSFGTSGVATGSSSVQINAIAVQPTDGKIVAVGDTQDGKFAVERFRRGGAIDTGFGTGGLAVTPLTGDADATAVAVQPDGKILVAGCDADAPLCPLDAPSKFGLARYNADGSVDTTFGSNGTVSWAPAVCRTALGFGVAVQTDGKIVVGGSCDGSFAVARFQPNGTLDTTFDRTLGPLGIGYTLASFNDYALGLALALDGHGRIVVAGDVTNSNGQGDAGAARFLADGSPDTTFGSNGTALLTFGSEYRAVEAVAIDSSDRIAVAGSGAYASTTNNWSVSEFAVGRWTAAGKPDGSFGTGGVVETRFSTRTIERQADAAALGVQPDGDLVAAGYADQGTGSSYRERFALARYLPDGQRDLSFGANGKVVSVDGRARGLALTATGKILAGGDLQVARFQSG